MDTCTDTCTGHGCSKFRDCLSEALYCIGHDGPDAETGTVDWEAWYGLFIISGDETEPHDCGDSLCDAQGYVIPEGGYVLVINTVGFVTGLAFDSEDEARAFFDEREREYCAWDDQD